MLTVQSDNVVASAWQDRKVVTMMATGYDATKVGTVLRRQKEGSRKQVPCPIACVQYNKFMGGVYHGDQLRGYYQSNFKSRKFYKYIANFLFGVVITNSYILFSLNNPGNNNCIKSFREKLALQLLGSYCSRKMAGMCGGQYLPQLAIQHFPRKSGDNNACKKRGKCTICLSNKNRCDTLWLCRECKVWLCHTGTSDDCFLKWHSRPQVEP